MMRDTRSLLHKRLAKAEAHYRALREYKGLIDRLYPERDIFDVWTFNQLKAEERAFLDAYLKRFASLQDFLGAKVFPLLLEVAGIGTDKMTEVLYRIEREGIIDRFDRWIELREIRNELEHDYPEELADALEDLRACIVSFSDLERYCLNSVAFAKRYPA